MIVRSIADRAAFSDRKMAKSDLLRGQRIFAGLNCFRPGQKHALHTHRGQDKLYFVVEGEGEVTVGDETDRVAPGDLVLAPEGVPHALENLGPGNLVVMAIIAPPPSVGAVKNLPSQRKADPAPTA